MPKIVEKLMSYQGYMVYKLVTEKPQNWKLSDDLSKSHLVYGESTLGLKVGYGFSRFDISDQDSLQELTFIDKLILWPKVMAIRNKLTHAHIEKLL